MSMLSFNITQVTRLQATDLQEQPEYDACMTAAGPGIVTSIHGSQETLSTEEASTMQLPHFASLWTVRRPTHCAFAFPLT